MSCMIYRLDREKPLYRTEWRIWKIGVSTIAFEMVGNWITVSLYLRYSKKDYLKGIHNFIQQHRVYSY